MSTLGPEWDAVFREPLDARRVSGVVALLARLPRWDMGGSSVVLEAPYLCYDTVSDPLHGLVGDVADELTGFIHPRGINFAFRRADCGETVDGAAQVLILHVLQLVRQQKDQHVLMRGQYAGDLGIGVHSCCAPPSSDGVVALARVDADRNRSAIFSRDPVDAARTAFAARARLSEIELRHAVFQAVFAASISLPWWIRLHDWLYRALTRAGDLVARFGARISRGVA